MAVNKNFRSFYGGEKIAFDQFDNIVLVDPNKVVDSDGKQIERLVDHENLVMYANLEARMIPRTKLALGENTDQMSKNLKIANFGGNEDGKINFLKPQGKSYLDTSYTDQLTGQDSLNGKGINQTQITEEGTVVNNSKDTQLLGITSINIKNNSSYIPQVDIEMVDVQGRTLFELGEKSPYSAFLQLPYPLFFLTVKGYYGKAVKYELMMKSFNARFDPTDGNYKVSVSFIGRTAAILSDLSLGALFALPHMYETNLLIDSNEDPSDYNGDLSSLESQLNVQGLIQMAAGNNDVQTTPVTVTRGSKVINDVYSTYISKGLIDPSIPRLNLSALASRLNGLEEYVRQQFSKEDLSVLNDIKSYRNTLNQYREYITLFRSKRWPFENLDVGKTFVDNEGNLYYGLKKGVDGLQGQESAQALLDAKINEYNNTLTTNATFGDEGTYSILGKEQSSNIPVTISSSDLMFDLEYDDLNLEKTYELQKRATPTEIELTKFSAETLSYFEIKDKYYNKDLTVDEELSSKFYGFGQVSGSQKTLPGSFLNKLDKIERIYTDKAESIQKELSTALAQKIESPDGGLGFKPTIRNVMGMLMANVDAFYRLMDEVHRDAWNVKADPIRQNVIISESTANGVDSKDSVLSTNGDEKIIYPWPQYFETESDEDGNEKYVVKYVGDPKVESRTKAYLYDKWPEVEFIEEFIKGKLQRKEEQRSANFTNEKKEIKTIPVNATEFPYDNPPYINLSEVNFLYELWERTLLSSNYSKIYREKSSSQNLFQVTADFETLTIKNSIKSDPYLKMKLKKLGINSSNFENVLSHISNNGTGELWNTYLADVFVTPYIRGYNEKYYGLYDLLSYESDSPVIDVSDESQQKMKDFLKSSSDTDAISFTDVYPLTDLTWLRKNTSKGGGVTSVNGANSTINSMYFSNSKMTITSFNENRLFGDFADTPSLNRSWVNNTDATISIPGYSSIKAKFDKTITNNDYFATEGKIDYGNNYSGFTSRYQTTSLLNSPYFVNSLSESVENRKNNVDNPYVTMGYMYLNSLPLQTLKEKMNHGTNGKSNDYNFAIYNKFGALHKMPYAWVVKYGSIWHRYKKYINENVDILDSVWTSVNEDYLYDPFSATPSKTKTYTFPNYGGSGNTTYSMNPSLISIPPLFTFNFNTSNVGFYPKLVNDVNYLFGYDEFISGTTQSDFDNYFSGDTQFDGNGLKVASNSDSIINMSSGNTTYSVSSYYTFYDKPKTYDNTNNTEKLLCYPSAGGGNFNQYEFEICKTPGIYEGEPLRQSLYDGSIKTLWGGSHYGYFDTTLIKKPTYRQYIKTIDNTTNNQTAFSLESVSEYSSIDEILAVFNEGIMDMFETEFLEFCKDPVRDNIPAEDVLKPNLMTSLNGLFFINRPTLTGQSDLDGQIIANQQMISLRNTVQNLLSETFIFKQGNPSNFNRRVWYSFTDDTKYQTQNQKINFGNYINDSLPTAGNLTTIAISESQYPDAWNALRLVVGVYDEDRMKYSDSGSTITDFFVEMDILFSENNVRQLGPIIQIYATQKYQDPTMTSTKFMSLFNQYLTLMDNSQKKVQNNLFTKLNKDLPKITEETEQIKTSMSGEVAKLELYEFFKTLNDKWIAGGDFQNRTLFEEFLFLDRANRDIGDKLIVDVSTLTGFINDKSGSNSIYTLIGHLFKGNNLLFMALPSYTNFYGVNEPSKNAKPEEGFENSASDVFGTFLEVDDNKSRPRFLCLYTDKVSKHLKQTENIDYRFGDDSFDMYKAQVLRENQTNKTDYAFSNKVVGFNVDFGVRNQGIFKSVSLDQSQFKDTSESFRILTDMANQSKGSKTSQQSTSLYNIYKNRSYNCQIMSMGNMMIQPTMYFNLRYVPMFTGPYWITDVSHSISPGNFITTFSGVRISKYSFPSITELTMSVNIDLLKRINESYKKPKEVKPTSETPSTTPTLQNGSSNSNGVSTNSTNGSSVGSSNCSPVSAYQGLDFITKQNTQYSYNDIITYVNTKTTNFDVKRLAIGTVWREQGYKNGYVKGINNNYVGLTTDSGRWSGLDNDKVSGQFCVSSTSDGRARSYFSFSDPNGSFDPLLVRYNSNSVRTQLTDYIGSDFSEDNYAVAYSKVYIRNWFRRINTDNELNDILNNPTTDDEKLIKKTYDNSIPIFKQAFRWSKNNGL